MTNSSAYAVALQAAPAASAGSRVLQSRRHPIDLSARMAVCDGNYIRLLKLFPDLAQSARREFTLPALGAAEQSTPQRVVLEVVETFKYTSTVSITLEVPGLSSAYYRPPAMLVRLYHDANTAEVISYQDDRKIHVLYQEDELPRYYPDEKEQVNLFLAEWLALCLEAGQGHPVMRPHTRGPLRLKGAKALVEQPDKRPPPAAARLVQVTDTHLYADTADVLVGMNCEEGMRDVISMIQRAEGPLAAVLCTGDISQDNSSASYQRFAGAVATLGAPQYWIAGNHDEVPKMKAAIGADDPCFARAFSVPGWRVIMLNSNVVGEVYGRLERAELEFLASELDASKHEKALVCLHHNCVPVNAAWLQSHALKNPADLFAVLDRHTHVKAVLFGHIHQELVQERKQVLYLGSPSTCIQFHPDSNDFKLDTCNPGYRWLELASDGGFRTGIKRITDKSYQVDFSGIGY